MEANIKEKNNTIFSKIKAKLVNLTKKQKILLSIIIPGVAVVIFLPSFFCGVAGQSKLVSYQWLYNNHTKHNFTLDSISFSKNDDLWTKYFSTLYNDQLISNQPIITFTGDKSPDFNFYVRKNDLTPDPQYISFCLGESGSASSSHELFTVYKEDDTHFSYLDSNLSAFSETDAKKNIDGWFYSNDHEAKANSFSFEGLGKDFADGNEFNKIKQVYNLLLDNDHKQADGTKELFYFKINGFFLL